MLTNEVRSSSATWEWTETIQIVVAKSKEKKNQKRSVWNSPRSL